MKNRMNKSKMFKLLQLLLKLKVRRKRRRKIRLRLIIRLQRSRLDQQRLILMGI